MTPQYLLDYPAIHQKMYELMSSAKESIILCSLIANSRHKFYHDQTLEDIIKLKLAEGVAIKVITTKERRENKPPKDKFARKVFRYASTWGKGMKPWHRFFVHFKPRCKPFVHHQKYLLVDKKHLIIGGCHIHSSCTGAYPDALVQGKHYYIHEGALCLQVPTKTGLQFYEERFEAPFVTDHEAKIIELINKSEAYIYLENQYIYSNATSHNRVFEALTQKMATAHKAGQRIRLVVIGNRTCADETRFISKTYLAAYQSSMRYFYKKMEEHGWEASYTRSCPDLSLRLNFDNYENRKKKIQQVQQVNKASRNQRSTIRTTDQKPGLPQIWHLQHRHPYLLA